jgi:hypothetical protein
MTAASVIPARTHPPTANAIDLRPARRASSSEITRKRWPQLPHAETFPVGTSFTVVLDEQVGQVYSKEGAAFNRGPVAADLRTDASAGAGRGRDSVTDSGDGREGGGGVAGFWGVGGWDGVGCSGATDGGPWTTKTVLQVGHWAALPSRLSPTFRG